MNYDTEAWYKLYVRESTEDKLLPVLNRALRDFLLRLAKSRTDATILGKTSAPGEDIARALGATGAEAETIAEFIRSMLSDGYLSHRRGRLWITNFVDAQAARSPGAKRQEKWRDKKTKASKSETQPEHNEPVSEASHGDVSRASHETSHPIRSEKIRSETRREDPNGARPPGDFGIVGTVPEDELRDDWQPNTANLALAKRFGLDEENERGKYRAHRKRTGFRCGNWDADYEIWLRNAKDFSRDRRPPGALAHASRPPAEDLPPAPAHQTFADQERTHATRLAKALAGDYGPKLAVKAADMPASQLRAVVERLERGRPTAVGNLLAGVGRAAE